MLINRALLSALRAQGLHLKSPRVGPTRFLSAQGIDGPPVGTDPESTTTEGPNNKEPNESARTKTDGTLLSPVCMAALNVQLGKELEAFHSYLAKYLWFQRPDVALHGFAGYFLKNFQDEIEHSLDLAHYLTQRGGQLALEPALRVPEKTWWHSVTEALQEAMEAELDFEQRYRDLVRLAEAERDANLGEIMAKFLDHQIRDVTEKREMLTVLRRCHRDDQVQMLDLRLQMNGLKGNWTLKQFQKLGQA